MQRLALEAIATRVHVKKTAVDQVLRFAAVPEELIRRFLTECDPATGERRFKRNVGVMVLGKICGNPPRMNPELGIPISAQKSSRYPLKHYTFAVVEISARANLVHDRRITRDWSTAHLAKLHIFRTPD